MKNLWEKRRQPIPIQYEKAFQIKELNQNGQNDSEQSTRPKLNDQRIQSISDYVQMFIDSLNELKQRSDKQRKLGMLIQITNTFLETEFSRKNLQNHPHFSRIIHPIE